MKTVTNTRPELNINYAVPGSFIKKKDGSVEANLNDEAMAGRTKKENEKPELAKEETKEGIK